MGDGRSEYGVRRGGGCRCRTVPDRHERLEKLRAFRPADAEDQVRQRMAALAVLLSRPAEISRALRDARKAAWGRGAGYDPARHAALLRLQRQRCEAAHMR